MTHYKPKGNGDDSDKIAKCNYCTARSRRVKLEKDLGTNKYSQCFRCLIKTCIYVLLRYYATISNSELISSIVRIYNLLVIKSYSHCALLIIQ